MKEYYVIHACMYRIAEVEDGDEAQDPSLKGLKPGDIVESDLQEEEEIKGLEDKYDSADDAIKAFASIKKYDRPQQGE